MSKLPRNCSHPPAASISAGSRAWGSQPSCKQSMRMPLEGSEAFMVVLPTLKAPAGTIVQEVMLSIHPGGTAVNGVFTVSTDYGVPYRIWVSGRRNGAGRRFFAATSFQRTVLGSHPLDF